MEQDYRARQKDTLFSSPEEVEEKIQKLYSEISCGKWGRSYFINYYALAVHSPSPLPIAHHAVQQC